MASFATPLDVRKVEGEDALWELLATLAYAGKYAAQVEVPAGYVTDFASVPRLLWVLFPQSGRWDKAAVVHDYLITDELVKYGAVVSSAQVDAEFRAALQACNVGWVRRWLMWSGVRWAAVASKVRRPGWLKTLPQLTAVTAVQLAPLAGAVWALVALI